MHTPIEHPLGDSFAGCHEGTARMIDSCLPVVEQMRKQIEVGCQVSQLIAHRPVVYEPLPSCFHLASCVIHSMLQRLDGVCDQPILFIRRIVGGLCLSLSRDDVGPRGCLRCLLLQECVGGGSCGFGLRTLLGSGRFERQQTPLRLGDLVVQALVLVVGAFNGRAHLSTHLAQLAEWIGAPLRAHRIAQFLPDGAAHVYDDLRR